MICFLSLDRLECSLIISNCITNVLTISLLIKSCGTFKWVAATTGLFTRELGYSGGEQVMLSQWAHLVVATTQDALRLQTYMRSLIQQSRRRKSLKDAHLLLLVLLWRAYSIMLFGTEN